MDQSGPESLALVSCLEWVSAKLDTNLQLSFGKGHIVTVTIILVPDMAPSDISDVAATAFSHLKNISLSHFP